MTKKGHQLFLGKNEGDTSVAAPGDTKLPTLVTPLQLRTALLMCAVRTYE